jgi:hypothetical protein
VTDVLGTEDPRFTLPRLPQLPRDVRWVASAAALVLAVGVLTAVRGLPPRTTLVVAADGVLRVRADGHQEKVALPPGLAPVRLLRIPHATVLLVRPPGRATGGRALLLQDISDGLRDLGPADALAPDARADRVWLVRGSASRELQAFDGTGRRRGTRHAATTHDLLLVTPDGVLDDEVVLPGGSTPTLRADDGRVVRRLDGPVQVLDVVGPRLLVTTGACLDSCTTKVWDVRDGSSGEAPLDAGLLVVDGALSADGRSAALLARSAAAGQEMDGDRGEAVLLRGRLDGNEPRSAVVFGGCTLRACRVTWSGDTVYASVDLQPGTLLTWAATGAPRQLGLAVPDVVDLAGL